MIEKFALGKTSYGGEVYWLEAEKPWEIPAIRCVISTGKIKKEEASVEEAINYFNKNLSEAKSLVTRVYEQKHSSIGETSTDGIYLKAVSRLFTFVGWMSIGAPRGLQGVGTEKSLRRVRAADYIDTGDKSLKRLCEKCLEKYRELSEAGYPIEDARYLLPLATRTEEILQIPLGRELGKWSNYLQQLYFTEAVEVGKILKKWNTEKSGVEVNELPSRENFMPLRNVDKIPERKYLERFTGAYYFSLSDTFLMHARGSISSFHQEVRDRQERILWPSWEETVLNSIFVMPSSLRTRKETLRSIYNDAQDLGKSLWEEGKKESAVYAQLLGKEMDVISSIHGRDNIIYTLMLRTCCMAQEEIRSRFRRAAEEIEKKFGSRPGPRCEIEGKCYEARRKECPQYRPNFEPEMKKE